jgi:AcrR family transcriptional regulator
MMERDSNRWTERADQARSAKEDLVATPPTSTVSASRERPRIQTIRLAAMRLFAESGYRATTMEDIGSAAGIKGPSIYKHYSSKQQLLFEIMSETMSTLIREQQIAVGSSSDVVAQLRRAAEWHARYHVSHRYEAFIGNREINNLEATNRKHITDQRHRYEAGLREIIQRGLDEGQFSTSSARLSSYAILDMGIGISAWYRPDGPHTENELVYAYGEFALRIVGAPSS